MAIDDREDGLWAVQRDSDGNRVETNLYTAHQKITAPVTDDRVKDDPYETGSWLGDFSQHFAGAVLGVGLAAINKARAAFTTTPKNNGPQ